VTAAATPQPPPATARRPATPPWTYRARVYRVIDGDTIDVDIDLGFRTYTTQLLRLLRVKTPERGQPDYDTARLLTLDWCRRHGGGQWPLLVTTARTDKYGRFLAEVRHPHPHPDDDDVCLNDVLVTNGWPDIGRAR